MGETAGPLDETDVDPCELFVAVGMLVLESRLPTASVKGRRDGLHCPQAVGHWSSHECDLTQPQVVDSYSVIRPHRMRARQVRPSVTHVCVCCTLSQALRKLMNRSRYRLRCELRWTPPAMY